MPKPQKSSTGIYTLMVTFNSKRRKLTLGRIDKQSADAFASNMAQLVSYKKHDRKLSPTLASFVHSFSKKHRKQLGEIGLIQRFDLKLTVGELIEDFLEQYRERPSNECSDYTKSQFEQSMKHRIPDQLKKQLLDDLEPKKDSERINAKPVFTKKARSRFSSVESWQREFYAKSTWSKANKNLKEIGKWAVDQGVCDHNPFVLLKSPGEVNPDRNEYVPAEWVDDAMDMCLDPDTRLAFALGRYAGFRLPSEARKLKPRHIDFEKSQLTIFGKKNKERKMPLFDRVRNELERHRSQSPWGRFVLSDRFRTTADQNNYNLMKEAVARTGQDLWVRLRQNLRASCENDLLNEQNFSERLVTLWIGHTVTVSRKHYQKLKDKDYLDAVAKQRK